MRSGRGTRKGAETTGLKGDGKDADVLKIKSEERSVEAKIARAVAGFDLTFSAPKTVSVAWALADGGTQVRAPCLGRSARRACVHVRDHVADALGQRLLAGASEGRPKLPRAPGLARRARNVRP
jgi:hypothetical protein